MSLDIPKFQSPEDKQLLINFYLEILKISALSGGWDGVSDRYITPQPLLNSINVKERIVLQTMYVLALYHQLPVYLKNYILEASVINGIDLTRKISSGVGVLYKGVDVLYKGVSYKLLTDHIDIFGSIKTLLDGYIRNKNGDMISRYVDEFFFKNMYSNSMIIHLSIKKLSNTAAVYLMLLGLEIPNAITNLPKYDNIEKYTIAMGLNRGKLQIKYPSPKQTYVDTGKFIDYKIVGTKISQKISQLNTTNKDIILTVMNFIPMYDMMTICGSTKLDLVSDVCNSMFFRQKRAQDDLNITPEDFRKYVKEKNTTPTQSYNNIFILSTINKYLTNIYNLQPGKYEISINGNSISPNYMAEQAYLYMIIRQFSPSLTEDLKLIRTLMNAMYSNYNYKYHSPISYMLRSLLVSKTSKLLKRLNPRKDFLHNNLQIFEFKETNFQNGILFKLIR